MARPSRTALHADDPTYLWKAILRAIAILFAIVGVGTIAWALINHVARGIITPSDSTGDDYGGYDDYYDGGYDSYYTNFATLPWTFITLGLSILWNIANLAVLFFRNKPIHPGANVGCDLVLWLGLCATGSTAVIGALNYFDYYPGSYDDGDNPYDSYGTFSNSSGTWYDLPNGSLVNKTVASGCGGFSTCAEERRYEIALQHKGVVIAVGAAMSFMVLLFHFALFISACRYTHARRYGVGSKHAKAITSEATAIAQKMIAEMTGPNGTFRPRSQQQQPESQPLMSTPTHAHGGTGDVTSAENVRQPSPPSPILDLPPPDLPQGRYGDTLPVSNIGESSSAAANRVRFESSSSDVHPALRAQRVEISEV